MSRAGRRWAHTYIDFRRCRIGFCLPCWVRQLTGTYVRRRRAFVRRADEIARIIPPENRITVHAPRRVKPEPEPDHE